MNVRKQAKAMKKRSKRKTAKVQKRLSLEKERKDKENMDGLSYAWGISDLVMAYEGSFLPVTDFRSAVGESVAVV